MGDRDPAQPLVTWLDGPARAELSGATTATWVAKTAGILVHGYAGPARVGVLLPLHWQTVVAVLGSVTAGATAVVAREPAALAGCDVALVAVEHAEAALDAGVPDVLAVSTAPLGGRLGDLPPLVLDHGAEVPGYADSWTGPLAREAVVEVEGARLPLPVDALGLGPDDRVATSLDLATAPGLSVALAALGAGAALLLVAGDADLAQERPTAAAGLDAPGARRIG